MGDGWIRIFTPVEEETLTLSLNPLKVGFPESVLYRHHWRPRPKKYSMVFHVKKIILYSKVSC